MSNLESNEQEQPPQDAEQQEETQIIEIYVITPRNQMISVISMPTSESINLIKQGLSELQETSFYTSYSLKLKYLIDGNGIVQSRYVSCNEFSELGTFLNDDTKACIFEIITDIYDSKRVLNHVKRTKEIITSPYLTKGLIRYDEGAFSSGKWKPYLVDDSKTKVDEDKKKGIREAQLPKLESISSQVNVENFYDECLFKEGFTDLSTQEDCNFINKVIKSIFISGWNPVPPERRAQGDLFYLEIVTATEGTLYVTASTEGFFLNRSNRNTFNPKPVHENPCFSHELLLTILSHNSAFLNSWIDTCKAVELYKKRSEKMASPMNNYASNLTNLKEEDNLFQLPWNVLPDTEMSKHFPSFGSLNFEYDMFRAQEELSNLHGADELGAPREWNDEIQSIRSIKAKDLNEKLLKARLEYKVINEFSLACKNIAVAISQGLIAPISYSDPSQSEIFIYNGIFFSRAEDSKDSFKLCNGDEAFRKISAKDIENQKLIRSLEIEGLGTVLCTLVDYKGERFIGQSIIPGIFIQGDSSARLMHGVLERGKDFTMKNSSLNSLRELGKKLMLAERNIPSCPFKSSDMEPTSVDNLPPNDSLNKLFEDSDSEKTSAIKIDTIDNVDSSNGSIPHIGPIEGKTIKGSDGRVYALEFMRLTPLDANFILEPNGTGKIDQNILSSMDKDLGMAYVLRNELINIFLQRKVNIKRQEILTESVNQNKDKESVDKDNAMQEVKTTPSAEEKEVEVEDDIEIVKDKSSKSTEVEPSESEVQNKLAQEYVDKYFQVTAESLGIRINPNCFISEFESDVDAEVRTQDENLVREISSFLFDNVIPTVVHQVREGEFSPKDSESMVKLLHRMGINMRYLGQIALISREQELVDADLLFESKQRVHSMPFYWLEMIVVEILSRSVKHLLNQYMRSNKLVASRPASTIAAILNSIFSLFDINAATQSNENGVEENQNDDKHIKEASEPQQKKKKKKNKPSKSGLTEDLATDIFGSKMEPFPSAPNAISSKKEFLSDLTKMISSRFFVEINFGKDSKEERNSNRLPFNIFVRRIIPITLLRRICKSCGIRIHSRAYSFYHADPFTDEDIISLEPIVKTCEPEVLMSEYNNYLSSSAVMLQEGNFSSSFEYAQQANALITQITGPYHSQATQANDQLATILLSVGDFKPALEISNKSLSTSAYIFGMDSQESYLHHIQLALIHTELENYNSALKHLLTALYLIQMLMGPKHPEISNIFTRISILYDKVGDFNGACQSLLKAKVFSNDLHVNSVLTMSIAELCYRYEHYPEAVAMQKSGYKVLKELVSQDDERLLLAKKNLEKYLREASEKGISTIPSLNNALTGLSLSMDASDTLKDSPYINDKQNAKKKKKKNNKSKK